MLELCNLLKITVNDLLNGEVVTMENYNEKVEQQLLEMVKQKEAADKRLLKVEIFIGVISVVCFIALLAVGAWLIESGQPLWIGIPLICIGSIQFLVVTAFALKIEQTAGYYVCAKCGQHYAPKYVSVLFAMHVNRTRWMKCPECGKWSWQKKVLSKEA